MNLPDIIYKRKPSNSHAVFSILIPTWNNLEYLKLCIASIEKNSKFPHQILIHVNEGSDGTLDWVKNTTYSFSYSAENIGVCHSLNSLASLCETDYILYMNDDMYVCENWDEFLHNEIIKKGDSYFYYSGTMVEYEFTGNKAVLAPHDFGRTYDEFDEQGFKQFVDSTNKADWFGACWPPSIVHKKLWDEVGGYDPAYSPGFYSDPDFAMKLWHAGVRDFRGIGKSLIYHFRCKSTGRVIRNNGRKLFAQKWGVAPSYLYKVILKMGQDAQTGSPLKFEKGIPYLIARIKGWYIANF